MYSMNQIKEDVEHVHSRLQRSQDESAVVKVGQFDVQLLSQSITKCFINSNSVQHSIIKPWRSEVLSFSRWKITSHYVVCLNSLLGDKTDHSLMRQQPVQHTASQRPTKLGNNHISISQLSFLQSLGNLWVWVEKTMESLRALVLIPVDPIITINKMLLNAVEKGTQTPAPVEECCWAGELRGWYVCNYMNMKQDAAAKVHVWLKNNVRIMEGLEYVIMEL